MIDDTAPSRRPQRTIGHKFLGYRASLNLRHEILAPDGGLFPTVEAAKAAGEKLCPYALEWKDNFYSISIPDDPRNGVLCSSTGGHPRAMAQDQAYASSGYRGNSDPNIMEELGHEAWWNRYHVEHVTQPITEDIPGAEYVSGSFNIRPGPGGWWDVFFGDDYRWVSSHHTRAEAIAAIWQPIAKEERAKRSLFDRAFDRLDRWLLSR